ncbi:WYL domain-containing protein [Marinobacter sp. SS5-14b]|uniref:WYL domain-containing protein n=1 Tax=Marinobacter sp. SS5-14b TaxID=3050456 RepID=UPI0026DFBA50|nr:WYL domain-containing protein [Marinobacter sp. SS5-14b]
MSDQLRRQIEILKLLPRPGLAKSTGDIHKQLKERDHDASKRTVERDLENLLEVFPMSVYKESKQGTNGRTNYWHLTSLKGLLPETLLNDNDAALALTMLKQQAYNRLPRSVVKRVDSLWQQATTTTETDQNAQRWMQLLQYLPDPMRPESPAIDSDVQSTIEEALASSDALNLTMLTLDGEIEFKKLLPLRLLLQEEILYLLAEYPDAQSMDDSIQLLPLHRITKAEARLSHNDSSLEPDLAQAHALGMEDSIRLVIRINRPLAEALFNRPIGREQSLMEDADNPGHYLVTTYIDNSPQLRRWLTRRNGKELEIVEPEDLV